MRGRRPDDPKSRTGASSTPNSGCRGAGSAMVLFANLKGDGSMRHVALAFGCSVVLVSGLAVAQQHNMPSATVTDEEIIKSAMSAAPESIGKGATIIDVGSDGKVRVVRQGSNHFTCMADNPNTPGPDPMCADRNAMEWVE